VPATRPTRRNTFDSLLAAYGGAATGAPLQAGHDQGRFNPLHAAANLQRGGSLPIVVAGRRNHRPRNQQQGGPGVLANGNNACFGAAGLAFITTLEVNSSYVPDCVLALDHSVPPPVLHITALFGSWTCILTPPS
jgi:hypothetical protein